MRTVVKILSAAHASRVATPVRVTEQGGAERQLEHQRRAERPAETGFPDRLSAMW